jgi:hypothetical protein
MAADHNSSGIGDFLERRFSNSRTAFVRLSILLPSPIFFPIVVSSYEPNNDSSCGPIPSRALAETTQTIRFVNRLPKSGLILPAYEWQNVKDLDLLN